MPRPDPVPCMDHLGNEYQSIGAMARAYGLEPVTVRARMKRGWDIERILSPGQGGKGGIRPEPCMDGTQPKASVSKRTISYRMAKGMTREEAEKMPNIHGARPCVDHLGIEWPSVKKMCQCYRVDPEEYRNRIRQGKSLEEALRWWHAMDHKGHKFKYPQDMRQYWFITKSHYDRMLKKGMPLEGILTGWSQETLQKFDMSRISKVGDYWHVSYDGKDYVLSPDAMHERMCAIMFRRLMTDPPPWLELFTRQDWFWDVKIDGEHTGLNHTAADAWYRICTSKHKLPKEYLYG